MNINYNDINMAIESSWDKCLNFTFDQDTTIYINKFITEYYNRVQKGLIDFTYSRELRIKLFNELLNLIIDKKCALFDYILNCINDIENENNSENVLINSIFKLQSCKNIEW